MAVNADVPCVLKEKEVEAPSSQKNELKSFLNQMIEVIEDEESTLIDD